MTFAGLDFNMFIEDGIRGLIYLAIILIGLGIIWGVKSGKLQLVVYRYGDFGFLEIFGRPWLHIKMGVWLYVEGVVTQSKTSSRDRIRKHIRRDFINGQVVITEVSYAVHVMKTRQDAWNAIYKFYDEDTNLSDGHNQAFIEYIDMELGRATRALIKKKQGVDDLTRDELAVLCQKELAEAGVSLLRVAVRDSAPPNEYSTGMGLLAALQESKEPGEAVTRPPAELAELGVVALKTGQQRRA